MTRTATLCDKIGSAHAIFDNGLHNGLLPIVLRASAVAEPIAALQQAPGMEVGVDLAAQTASTPVPHAFAIDPFRKDCPLSGVGALGLTPGLGEEIIAFACA